MDDEFWVNKKIVDERRKSSLKNQAIFAKNKLKDEMTKKLKTVMIGALASFEKGFGELMGPEEGNLTAEEEAFCDIWEEVRQDILDKGNKQIRAAQDEIDCYEVQYNKNQYKFNLKGEDR